ncbi:MAG: VWA domain-containing protein [Pseudomonadota bacterium]
MRRTRFACKLITAVATMSVTLPSLASDVCTDDAIVVFDGSGSMAEMGFNNLDEPRILEARRAIEEAIPPIAEDRRIGLVIYGPNGDDDCSGIELYFGPVWNAAPRIIGAVNRLVPTGDTPLTEATKRAVSELSQTSPTGSVVVVTDGKETCMGMPCQLAAELAGGPYTVHVIGFKVRGEFFAWSNENDEAYENAETVARCLADRTGGQYIAAENAKELVNAFHETLGCKLLF